MTTAERQLSVTVDNPYPITGGAITFPAGSWINLGSHFCVALVAWYTFEETNPDHAGVIRTLPAAWLNITELMNTLGLTIPFATPLDQQSRAVYPDHYAAYYKLGATWDLATAGIRIGCATRNAITLTSTIPWQAIGTTTGAPSTNTLIDSTANFLTLDSVNHYKVEVGDIVLNTTDGSSCTVLAVDTTTLSCTNLAGGTDNTFATSDAYEIQRKITLGAAAPNFNLLLVSDIQENLKQMTAKTWNSKIVRCSFWDTDNEVDSVDIEVGATSFLYRAYVNKIKDYIRNGIHIKLDNHDWSSDESNSFIKTYYGKFTGMDGFANVKGINKRYNWGLHFDVEDTVLMPDY